MVACVSPSLDPDSCDKAAWLICAKLRRGKILVVGAVEVQDGGAGPGRIRLKEILDLSSCLGCTASSLTSRSGRSGNGRRSR
jgi:hypothetical protein